jgi:GH15 family glucan-1,4-alpha-glucosidase
MILIKSCDFNFKYKIVLKKIDLDQYPIKFNNKNTIIINYLNISILILYSNFSFKNNLIIIFVFFFSKQFQILEIYGVKNLLVILLNHLYYTIKHIMNGLELQQLNLI